jgi:hypothetical protein
MQWKPYDRYNMRNLLLEVKSTTPLDDVAAMISKITGICQGDFRLEILQNSSERSESKTRYSRELTRSNFETTGNTSDMFELRVATVRMDCTDPGGWKSDNPLEARFVSLLEKNKNERTADKNEFWKVQQYKISHTQGPEFIIRGWHELRYMPQPSGKSHLPCDFNAHRYPTVCGGNPNDVAVDFGSSGHPPVRVWESTQLQCSVNPTLCVTALVKS